MFLTKLFQRSKLPTRAFSIHNNTPEHQSKHRKIMSLYDLAPNYGYYCYISPSALLSGEVFMQDYIQVFDNAVLRGDINVIRIASYTSVGANSVLRTVASLPTGVPAVLQVGANVIIEPGCTLVSCDIGNKCWIGAKSVILEGAKLSDESMIGPNSIVPPGRLIPSGQLWAGNPVRFIRHLTGAEKYHIKSTSEWMEKYGKSLNDEYSQYKTGY